MNNKMCCYGLNHVPPELMLRGHVKTGSCDICLTAREASLDDNSAQGTTVSTFHILNNNNKHLLLDHSA